MLYDTLYAASEGNILWGEKPGRIVRAIRDYITCGRVLDIGCGDGKNALYLEKLGFDVTGCDCSEEALKGLRSRFAEHDHIMQGTYNQLNIEERVPEGEFDVLVSYGVLHCLTPKTRIACHKSIQDRVRSKGYMFFTCLTEGLPFPEGHGTEGVTVASLDEIDALLEGWNILYKEVGVIAESHEPIIGKHTHSAVWIVAQKE